MRWCIDCEKYGKCEKAEYADSPACQEFENLRN